jgi:outer membrane protein OmpA-like peptidoglycan-associated protein
MRSFHTAEKAGSTARRRTSSPARGAKFEAWPGIGLRVPDGYKALVRSATTGGRPLSAAESGYFEPRFGLDLTQVRIHEGPRADDAADALGARAFTWGSDVVLRSGEYRGAESSGRRLLAHELAHAVQQGSARGEQQRSSEPRIQRLCGEDVPATSAECVGLGGDPGGLPILFDVNCDTVRGDQAPAITSIVARIGPRDSVQIHGVASEEGPPALNERLSCRRAMVARDLLTSRGVNAARLRRPLYAHGALRGDRETHRAAVIQIQSTAGPTDPERGSGGCPPRPHVSVCDLPGYLAHLGLLPTALRRDLNAEIERSMRGEPALDSGVVLYHHAAVLNERSIADARHRFERAHPGCDSFPIQDHTLSEPPCPRQTDFTSDQANALAIGQLLQEQYPGWMDVLPDCPCTDAQATASPLFTGRESASQTYHPGAATCHRSASSYSSIAGTAHGQQCCYDAAGNLLTHGPGAGTPDFWAPSGTNVLRHYSVDVQTFNALSWSLYTLYWRPNAGPGCPRNGG